MADKVSDLLLESLRQMVAGPAEQRLFRSGKLLGLFASRTGANAEAAALALKDGLLEVVRTELRGKVEQEMVRLTPRGLEYLHEHDSPVRVLEELRDLLRMTREGMPVWLLNMQQELRASSDRLVDEVRAMNHRLETLGECVDAALRRSDVDRIPLSNGAATVAWARDAMAYLERRREEGREGPCPLPELFAALRPRHAELLLPAFLDGLRRLHDHRAVQLLPFQEPADRIPEPEYALADGGVVMYYVDR